MTVSKMNAFQEDTHQMRKCRQTAFQQINDSPNGKGFQISVTCEYNRFSLLLVCMYVYVCIPNWPLPIGAFQDQCRQTMINKYSNKHNQVKNTNWREADQLAINKRSREVKLGTAENNISQRSEQDLNPGPADFKSGALTTRPLSLPFLEKKVKDLGKQEKHLIVVATRRWCWFHQPN